MTSVRPSLVIFDCDGVLVDTEHVANQLLSRLVTEAGAPLTYEECRKRFLGKSMKTVQAEVEELAGRSLPEDWHLMVRTQSIKVFGDGIEAIPHVKTQILRLQDQGTPYCVASSGQIAKMHATLGSSGLLPLVENVLFSADMVKRGKPAPDLFLHAANTMGHAPETCVVIEDSRPGVEAGIAAGMRVLGYAGDPMTDGAALEATGATVFTSMEQLPELLRL
ncbi:HAD family phosphatase [Parvibaculaceae bacterium PLY_AMNH_Bact1]|nr:HAD family phosphatase [Parvibaculaceae bacterium PLY_AMNH_Bact1]